MKIQITTIEKTANVQVIELNTYIVSKVLKAQMRLSDALEKAKHTKQEYKLVDEETGKKAWVDTLDEKGNPIVEYHAIDGEMLNDDVMPLLDELVKAFEE